MISITTAAIGLLIATIITVLIRRDALHAKHGFGWFAVALGFAFLGISPSVIDELASKLGIGYPPALAFTLALAVIVVKILTMDMERSRIEVRGERLIQRIGILETELTALTTRVTALESEDSP